ncbi:Uncharacterised protein [Mycobacteroides abscessus subsp. abscessus]|nr:Uncharacterised protein [Mycobacteroides abscessus subsp. abscessus]
MPWAVNDAIEVLPGSPPGDVRTRLPDNPAGRTGVVFGRLPYTSAIWFAAAVASAAVRYRATILFSERLVPVRNMLSGVDAEAT